MLYHLLLVLVAVAQAQLYVGFPINEQLPDVARVGQEYSFTFSSQTYKSYSDGTIEYTASNFPQWMDFNASTRTFSGVPSSDDVGEFKITVGGTDSADQAQLLTEYSMVVSNDTGLHLLAADGMFVQISKYGQTNGNDGLVLKQGDQFNIQFDKSTFESYANSTRKIVAYYGRSQDRSSLPNWIYFDGDNCSFSGTVPYVTLSVAPSIDYSFAFIGSDYYGYTGAEGIFKIVVGAHQLSTSVNETIKINGTFNSDFDLEVPVFSEVYLDGAVIAQANISLVYVNDLPSFVTFNTSTYTLSGKFPSTETFDNFSVSIKDVYQNTVEIPYSFDSLGSVFTVSHLPDVNATQGEWFQYQLLNSYFTDVNSTTVTANYSDASWLTYHSSNKTLNGWVPRNMKTLLVDVSASSQFGSETKSFTVRADGSAATSSSSTGSTATATSSASASASAASKKKSNSSHGKELAIGLGVGLGVAFLVVCALLFMCCMRRRNAAADEADSEQSPARLSSESSAKQVTAISALALEEKTDDEGDNGKSKGDESDAYSTSSSVTHVDESRYVDAEEKPMKSWRANDRSDRAKMKRESELSMSTVNTENLFLVRLVDDKSLRDLGVSESLGSRNFLSNSSLNEAMTRSLLGNVQKLDSEGNIVGIVHGARNDLDAVTEENSRDNSGVHHETLGGFSSYRFNEETDTSSYDLLQKFSESRNPLQSNSERDFSNYDLRGTPYEDFHATRDEDGEFKWSEGSFGMNLANTSGANLVTPVREHFYEELTPQTLAPSSEMSVHSTSTDIVDRLRLETTLKSKPKLMDFTRKGSLRELVHAHEFDFDGETARIHQ